MQLTSWDPTHLGSAPIAELWLPPLPPAELSSNAAVLTRTGLLLGNAAFRRRSGTVLVALHNLPVAAAVAGQLAGWAALRRLHLAPGSLPHGGSASIAAFPPSAFPPGLQELDLPVPRHPFRPASGLPPTLEAVTLRCSQDFILGGQLLEAAGAAEPAAAAAGAGGGEFAPSAAASAAARPCWRRLTVHSGRTAGLDLDDLVHLAGACRSLTLTAPLVMLSTSDPTHPALLAAPPVRSLEAAAAQYLAVLAPVLGAAGVKELRLVAGEASFYCRQPGRRAILDAGALPPAGSVQAPAALNGYTARLTWPDTAGGGGRDAAAPQAPCFCLSVVAA